MKNKHQLSPTRNLRLIEAAHPCQEDPPFVVIHCAHEVWVGGLVLEDGVNRGNVACLLEGLDRGTNRQVVLVYII